MREIFHAQDTMRILGGHPNLVRTGDMFAWSDDCFVEPTDFIEGGKILECLLDEHGEQALTWEEKTRIIKRVAGGLAHAPKRSDRYATLAEALEDLAICEA